MRTLRILPITIIKLSILFIIILPAIVSIKAQQNHKIRIGLTVDGPWDRNDELMSMLKREIKDALSSQAEVEINDDKILMGDWTQQTIRKLNDQLLADKDVDYVIGFGLLASQDLAKRKDFSKPVIAPVVIDPYHQEISFSSGTSGVKNLCYLIYPDTFERDIKLFKEIVPIKKLVIISSTKYRTALFPTIDLDKLIGSKTGCEVLTIYYDNSADEVLSAIPKDASAVYLNVVPMSGTELQKITRELISRRIPSFSLMGEYEVKKGIMAAASPDIFPRMIRRIALNIQRIALGDDPGMLSVTLSPAQRLYINLRTAFAVGISPKWNTLLEAELIQMDSTETPGAQQFTLKSALQRISEQNLDVISKLYEVNADAEKIKIARSNLFPRIDLSASGLQIDADRAQAGYQPERSGTVDLSVRQVIFSEPAMANVSIQSSLHDSKQSELEVIRLNTISEGAKLYLNYLRSRKLLRILMENLKLMRENYAIAEIRQSTGSAGPEEKLRWETEIADLRKTAMEVQSQVNQVQLALKQVLNIPLIYTINITDVSPYDPELLISNDKIRSYLEDPVSFDVLTDYLVQEGIVNSKEISQISSLIAAQDRGLSSIRNSFFMPSVAAFASYSNTFYKSNIVQPFQLTSIPSPPSGIPVEFPVYMGQLLSLASPKLPDNNNWNIGLQLSLNLSDGFATSASEQKGKAELNQLEYQKKSAEEKIALRIRYEMESLKAAYFGIQQSKAEQVAAQRTLKIVTDAYSRGAISILNLIDAQASALRADQVSVNASYDLLIGYMQLERAVGKYSMFLTYEEREQLTNKLVNLVETASKR